MVNWLYQYVSWCYDSIMSDGSVMADHGDDSNNDGDVKNYDGDDSDNNAIGDDCDIDYDYDYHYHYH